MSESSNTIPKGYLWEEHGAYIYVDGPLKIRFEKGYITVIMPNKEKRCQFWPAETATDITAEKGDVIEAFAFRMTVTDGV